MVDVKEIAVTANVDIGKNITELLEKLAHQIGTTADKIFPWYVKQQVIEGYVFLAVSIFCMFIGIMTILITKKGAALDDDGPNLAFIFVCGGFIVLFGSVIALAFGSSHAVTQIINPQYAALQTMTGDMAKLLGK